MMRIFLTITLLYCFSSFGYLFAQQNTFVTLSNEYPNAGQKITISYKTNDTVGHNVKSITALVYYLDNKNYPVDEIDLKSRTDNQFSGETLIPDSAKAFAIKIKEGDMVDDNNGKGYVFQVYYNQKPVKGAYAQLAYIRMKTGSESDPNTIGLTIDFKEAVEDYEKEFSLYPPAQNADELGAYYYAMTRLSGPLGGVVNRKSKEIIEEKIMSLRNSNNEKDILFEARLFRTIREPRKADSVEKVSASRFPNGQLEKLAMYNSYLRERSDIKRDSIFNLYLKSFPVKDDISDFLAVQLAAVSLSKGEFDKYNKYKKLMKDTAHLVIYVNYTAEEFAQKGINLLQAEVLAKQAVDITKDRLDKAVSNDFMTITTVKKNWQNAYDTYCSVYNYVLCKEGRVKEALQLQYPVWSRNKSNSQIARNYGQMLMADNNYAGALNVAEINRIQYDGFLADILRQCYVKIHGSDIGFKHYADSLGAIAIISSHKTWIASITVNRPALLFTIMSLDDKAVSLTDFKGRIVVMALWASWQRVSTQYMQAMNKVVNNFKGHPDIVFLFINTWAQGDMSKDVRDSIKTNKYDFNVLLDKTPQNKYDEVVKLYKASNGQSVYIIDKEGNIRINGYVYFSDYTPESYAGDVIEEIKKVEDDKH